MPLNRGFYYDTNTGSPYLNSLTIGVNGIVVQFVDSEGRVGFGTAKNSLSAKVTISGNTSTPPLRLIGLTGSTESKILTVDSSGFVKYRSDITTNITVQNNIVTVTNLSGGTQQYTINAITGGTYSNGSIIVSGSGTISNISGIKTFYESNGNLTANRVVSTQNFTLTFSGASANQFKIVYTGATMSSRVLEIANTTGTTFYVTANGDLSATSKSFLIPNKSKKGYLLRHGSLEGPEHGVYFRGRITNSNRIEVPEYWKWLVDENTINVQLTPIRYFQNIIVISVDNDIIEIEETNGIPIDCYYIVFGERKDVDKMVVIEPI